ARQAGDGDLFARLAIDGARSWFVRRVLAARQNEDDSESNGGNEERDERFSAPPPPPDVGESKRAESEERVKGDSAIGNPRRHARTRRGLRIGPLQLHVCNPLWQTIANPKCDLIRLDLIHNDTVAQDRALLERRTAGEERRVLDLAVRPGADELVLRPLQQ